TPTRPSAAGAAAAAIARALAAGVPVAGAIALRHDLPVVVPALDADPPGRGARLVEAVVDVGAKRVQRDAPVGVALGPSHLGAPHPSGDLDLHPLRAGAHRRRQGALHRAPERDPVLELLADGR